MDDQRIENEVKDIEGNDESPANYKIAFTLEERTKYIQEFSDYIDMSKFLGDYSMHLIMVVFLIASAAIFFIVIIEGNPDDFWYGIYGGITVGGFIIFGFIGFKIKKKARKVRLEHLIDFIFDRMMIWTRNKLRKTKNEDDKRILIENIVSTFYDYTKFKNVKLWDKNLDLHNLSVIINAKENESSILLSMRLFDLIYTNDDGSYNEGGFLIITKVFLPILNLSSNPTLGSTLLTIIRKFMIDTKMNVFKSKVINKRALTKDDIVLVTNKLFKEQNFLDLFENIWKCQTVYKHTYKLVDNNVNEHIKQNITQLRYNKCTDTEKGWISLKTKDLRGYEDNLGYYKNINANDSFQPKQIVTQSNPFGINSFIFNKLKHRDEIEDKNLKYKEKQNSVGIKALKDIENMKKCLEDMHKIDHIDDLRVIDTHTIENKNKIRDKLSEHNKAPDSSEKNEELSENVKKNTNEQIKENFEIISDKDRSLSLEDNLKEVSDQPNNLDEENMKEQNKNDLEAKNLTRRESLRSLISLAHYEIPVMKETSQPELGLDIHRFLSIAKASTETFKLIINKDSVQIYKKHDDDSPIVLVRCDSMIKANIEKIFYLIYDIERRTKWDPVLCNIKIVKVLDESTDVMYSKLRTPVLVTSRDFVQKRTYVRNIDGFDIVIVFVSYEDKDFPPIKSVVRANTIISGYALKKIDDNMTHMITLSQTDIKGMIPLWIINRIASKAPFDWVKRLEKTANDIRN